MAKKRDAKKRPDTRRRIKRTPMEKLALVLWTTLCFFLVGVFVFMFWFMYNPKNRLAHNLKYGQRYLAAADYSKAVVEFRRVLAMDADNAEAYQGLMEAALQSEDTETAISLYGRAATALSGYKEPLLRLLEMRAVERVEQEDYDGAFSVAVTVEKTTGDANEAALIRALVIDGMLADAKKKSGEDAIALYRRILSVNDIDAAAVYELMARVYIDQGDEDEAVAVLDEGIEATGGAENLTALREEYTKENAEVFLPDSFIRELNAAMAAGDFSAAAEIVRHELFLHRILEFAGEIDAQGEQTFDFTAIQPADMNTTMYAEYNDTGQLMMVIVDWERTTTREAVFNELVWVPASGEVLALSQKQRVTSENTLADEGVCWRVTPNNMKEIPSEDYYDELSEVFAGEGIDVDAEQDVGAARTDEAEKERDVGAETADEMEEDTDAGDGAARKGGVA